jgi:hypothetical protein
MVNRIGVVKLIELIIAIFLIMSILLIAYKRTSIEQKSLDLNEVARDILREIAADVNLRKEIITAQTDTSLIPNTINYVDNSLPDYISFELRACESGSACGQSAYRGEVYSAERIFGATTTGFNTVKLRLFLWVTE